MTINSGFAAIAVASSAVLVFGSTSHAEEPTFLNAQPAYGTVELVDELEYIEQEPVEISSPVPTQQKLTPIKPLKKKLPQPKKVATQMKSTVNIRTGNQHAVYDSSNTYVWGHCTWYAKNKRPDLPNGLGNGGQWVASAAAHGFATGSTPRVGAIGEQPGHVVYVEAVHGNGTVTISEMNYNGGIGVVHKRTVPASTFTYIY